MKACQSDNCKSTAATKTYISDVGTKITLCSEHQGQVKGLSWWKEKNSKS